MKLSYRPKVKKALYVISGFIALLFAYVGIIIPGIPGIPFIVLAAYFFANSSPRIYKWMMRQRLIRKLFNKSQKVKRGIFKALLISQVWFSVAVAELTLAHSTTAVILFPAGGFLLTALVFIFMKTRKSENGETDL